MGSQEPTRWSWRTPVGITLLALGVLGLLSIFVGRGRGAPALNLSDLGDASELITRLVLSAVFITAGALFLRRKRRR